MGNIALSVEGIGKRYRIGQRKAAYSTLRENLTHAAAGIFRGKGSAQQGSADFWALKDVSFEVKHGEVIGILGRNGAGKSTLLKILSRITEPSEGRARIFGRVGSLLEVGTGFHPELTGRENIYLNGAILGMGKAEINRKFDEIVAFAEVEQFLDTPVKRYSSGMLLRLGFAVSAHLEPDILIVDEVLAVGDAEFQKKCLGKMQQVAGQARTVLFVSHNMAAIQNLCSRAVMLAGGVKYCEGDVGQTIATYLRLCRESTASPLITRANRQGTGNVRFTEVAFRTATSKLTRALCGEALYIDLFYEAVAPLRSGQPFHIGIDLCDIYGTRLLNLSSFHVAPALTLEQARGRITCYLPNLPLLPGDYSLNISIMQNNEFLDRIQNAAELQVEPADVFGTGKLPKHGYFVVPHNWIVDGT